MKKLIINYCLNYIIKKQPNIDKNKLEIVSYGLTSLYLTISKLIIIFIIALLLHKLYLFIIFSIIYNIIRMPSFGLHASKSWICLIMSILLLVLLPCILEIFVIPSYIKGILGIVGVFLMFKNSPADTHKKPIVNPKRRRTYQQISTLIACSYIILSLLITDKFLSNCFFISIILQNILISPITYKLFNLPYNNYKHYLKLHPDFIY